jgi:membrane fusion protein (multidrug efflux system)
MTETRFPSSPLLILLAFVLSACGGATGQGAGPQQGPSSLPVLSVETRSVVLPSSYPTTLEGVQTVNARPRVQGFIVEMRVDEGDTVERGQVLFRLNNEEYQQAVRSAKADVEAARANVQQAENEVERLMQLVEKDIVSEYELKSARNTLQSRKGALSQAEASLENAQVDLNYTYVRSPADGVIGSIPYRIGSLVSSTSAEPLTVVSDISEVRAYFSMNERELLQMVQKTNAGRQDEALRKRIEDLPGAQLILSDGTTYRHRGDISLASGHIDTETGAASFRARFPNPERILRNGATASLQIPYRRDSSVVIPKSATYEVQDKRFVYRVTDSSMVESVEVRTSSRSTPRLFVVEAGLSVGDRIVTEGIGGLTDGAQIRAQPVTADSLYRVLVPERSASSPTRVAKAPDA